MSRQGWVIFRDKALNRWGREMSTDGITWTIIRMVLTHPHNLHPSARMISLMSTYVAIQHVPRKYGFSHVHLFPLSWLWKLASLSFSFSFILLFYSYQNCYISFFWNCRNCWHSLLLVTNPKLPKCFPSIFQSFLLSIDRSSRKYEETWHCYYHTLKVPKASFTSSLKT